MLSYSLPIFKISRIVFSPDAPYHTLGNCVLSISLNHQSFVHSPKFSRLLERTYHFPPGHVMCELLHFIYTKFATHHQLLPRDVSDQSLPQFLCSNFIPFWLTSSVPLSVHYWIQVIPSYLKVEYFHFKRNLFISTTCRTILPIIWHAEYL